MLPAAELGSVAMRLMTVVSGVPYRLTQAQVRFSGPSTLLIDTSTEPDAVVLQRTLPVGAYEVSLQQGWVLERDTGSGFQPVVGAKLVSENPSAILVSATTTALVAYEFETPERVTFAVGDVAVSIRVTDPALCTVDGEDLPVDDGNPCTTDSCQEGVLRHAAVADGTGCDDANACTADGVCNAGVCQSGAALPLPPLDVCGQAWCEPKTGSVYREKRADCLPRIEFVGSSALTLDCDQAYVEPGVSAQDAEDGPLDVDAPAAPRTAMPGTYPLVYSATDSSGNVAEAVRTLSVCGPRCGDRGREFINFGCGTRDAELPCPGGWQVELLGLPSRIDIASWRWNYKADPNFSFVNQLGLGAAPVSVLRSNYDAVDSVLEGKMRAPDLNSHNYFGLSFGHRGAGDFYLFEWLGQDNGGSLPPGMSIKRVNATLAPGGQLTNADFWGRKDSGPVQMLEQDGRRFQNDVAYPYWVDIPFGLEVHANAVRLVVHDPSGGADLVDWTVRGDNLGGPVGLYSFEGPPTAFVGLTRRPLPAACAGFPLN